MQRERNTDRRLDLLRIELMSAWASIEVNDLLAAWARQLHSRASP